MGGERHLRCVLWTKGRPSKYLVNGAAERAAIQGIDLIHVETSIGQAKRFAGSVKDVA